MGIEKVGLFNSNLDLAGADGISGTLPIGNLANGPMDRWPMGRWELAVGIPGVGRLYASFGPNVG